MKQCPCHSSLEYKDCCEPYHLGQKVPKSALDLMRSRYSAYATSRPNYIIKTTHPSSPHFAKDQKAWKSSIREFCKTTQFEGLEILSHFDEEPFAYVVFVAVLFQNKQDATFTEKSRFEKVEGLWLYLDGVNRPGKDLSLTF